MRHKKIRTTGDVVAGRTYVAHAQVAALRLASQVVTPLLAAQRSVRYVRRAQVAEQLVAPQLVAAQVCAFGAYVRRQQVAEQLVAPQLAAQEASEAR